jgi:glycosyltransferase involved in cell wall biosynthesis
MENQHRFTSVTLLITHYNRSRSLERLLKSFTDQQFIFGGIVVSDDGSKEEHLDYIKSLQTQHNFNLVTTPENKGLGNNINKGQDAVTTPYTLYVQEDFEPIPGFEIHFKDALNILEEREDFDIARFYAYFHYPYTKPFGKGFSEMIFRSQPWFSNHLKFHFYSDHPHLRRSNFFNKFGRYIEGAKGDLTEYTMSLSFICNKAKGIFYDDYTGLFYQKNSSDEPSTMNRSDWRQSKNPFILFMRFIYLQGKFIKCNIDLLRMQNNKSK